MKRKILEYIWATLLIVLLVATISSAIVSTLRYYYDKGMSDMADYVSSSLETCAPTSSAAYIAFDDYGDLLLTQCNMIYGKGYNEGLYEGMNDGYNMASNFATSEIEWAYDFTKAHPDFKGIK